jgi:RHS repeat-associated protein
MREAGSNYEVVAVTDRLGSVVATGLNAAFTRRRYFPYGEEQVTTASDTEKFGTYYRDQRTNLDYADQRYYSSVYGRFLTADPYKASGGVSDPASWNRYAYTRGDPINRYDPRGLEDEGPPFNPYEWLIQQALSRLWGLEDDTTEEPAPLIGVPEPLQESTRFGRNEALFGLKNITRNCSGDMNRTIDPQRRHKFGDALLSSVDRLQVGFKWDSNTWNSPAHVIIGGVEGSETFGDWFNKNVKDPENPERKGIAYGNLVVLTDSGDSPREMLKTIIHELFHVIGYLDHTKAAGLLELKPGQNGYGLKNASGLIDEWIDRCLGK